MKINIDEKQTEDGSYLLKYDFDNDGKSTEFIEPSFNINNRPLSENVFLTENIFQGGLYLASNNILGSLLFFSNLYDRFIAGIYTSVDSQEVIPEYADLSKENLQKRLWEEGKKEDRLIKLLNSYPTGIDLLSTEVVDNWCKLIDHQGVSVLRKMKDKGTLVRDHLTTIGIDYNKFRVQGRFDFKK